MNKGLWKAVAVGALIAVTPALGIKTGFALVASEAAPRLTLEEKLIRAMEADINVKRPREAVAKVYALGLDPDYFFSSMGRLKRLCAKGDGIACAYFHIFDNY